MTDQQTKIGAVPESPPVAGCGRSRVQRLLHPETVEDYGLTVPLGEFVSDPDGRREFSSWGAFHASHNATNLPERGAR